MGLLTTGIRQTIVPCVEMKARRANPDEQNFRARARVRENAVHAKAMVLPGRTVVIVSLLCFGACRQPLVVGEYKCPVHSIDGGSPPTRTDPISVPWSTGFENQLDCDYREVAGFCYGFPPGLFRVVASPVHTGQFAAEFIVLTGTDAGAAPQGRCVREGIFPTQAYYGAWYYISESATNTGLWNLFHFQGGEDYHGLWDISLANNGATGPLNLHLHGFLPKSAEGDGPPVPIGSWFHLEFYWKRAKDTSGEVALYQDGTRVLEFPNIVSDDSGTGQGQWYVGNLATALQPPQSTVYVDDITIRATR